jgi:hypothetical protein
MTNLVEFLQDSIINKIEDEIGPILDSLAIQRPDGLVTLENPADFFTYEKAIAYKTPAVFVVPTEVDFRLGKGQNHINAAVTMFVACTVEDRNQSLLQVKCFRYADALHRLLHMAVIEDATQKNVIKVMRLSLSGSEAQKSTVDEVFRKECLLSLSVEHYETEA